MEIYSLNMIVNEKDGMCQEDELVTGGTSKMSFSRMNSHRIAKNLHKTNCSGWKIKLINKPINVFSQSSIL